ncbi:MAG: sulfite exporter TauE/SafE family protein [Bosea sp. (in: a-proteobacteria)]
MLLPISQELLLAFLLFCGAALYSSVGHAGSSAYQAAMALFGVPPAVMRPTALTLNIIVSSLGTIRYSRSGLTDWRMLAPLLAGSIPAAFIAGGMKVPAEVYRPLLGAVLIFTAVRLLWPGAMRFNAVASRPRPWLALLAGAGIGALAGLTGTGGGIFLSPLLIFAGWSETRRASGTAAAFILFNSMAGLAGNYLSTRALPPDIWLFGGAVLAGGIIGTTLGISKLAVPALLKALAVVLLIAAAKLIFG